MACGVGVAAVVLVDSGVTALLDLWWHCGAGSTPVQCGGQMQVYVGSYTLKACKQGSSKRQIAPRRELASTHSERVGGCADRQCVLDAWAGTDVWFGGWVPVKRWYLSAGGTSGFHCCCWPLWECEFSVQQYVTETDA